MLSNAISASRMKGKFIDYLRNYIQNSNVFKRDLIHQLQHLPTGPRYGSEAIAADQIETVITLGHIEVKDYMCFWNHTPIPRLLGGQHNPLISRAPRVTKKRPWGHM